MTAAGDAITQKECVPGLRAAIKEVERLHDIGQSMRYRTEYMTALSEVLIYLRPMLQRAEKGEYLHSRTRVE